MAELVIGFLDKTELGLFYRDSFMHFDFMVFASGNSFFIGDFDIIDFL